MPNDTDVLTAPPADATNVIDQLPVRTSERDSLFASLNAPRPTTSTGMDRLRTALAYAAILLIATALAVVLMSMMGRQ